MTVIVAVTDGFNVHMGSDSSISSSDEIFNLKTSKIIQKDNILIGVSGTLRGLQLIQYNWDVPDHPNYISTDEFIVTQVVQDIKGIFNYHSFSIVEDSQEGQDSTYLIGYKGRIYTLDVNYQVFERDKPYAAIGSGSSFALGSLKTQEDLNILTNDPKSSIIRSIEAAKEFSPTVKGGVEVFKV